VFIVLSQFGQPLQLQQGLVIAVLKSIGVGNLKDGYVYENLQIKLTVNKKLGFNPNVFSFFIVELHFLENRSKPLYLFNEANINLYEN
jgi:hypothetical protein